MLETYLCKGLLIFPHRFADNSQRCAISRDDDSNDGDEDGGVRNILNGGHISPRKVPIYVFSCAMGN